MFKLTCTFYFLCLDTKKVTKKNQGLRFFMGSVRYSQRHALQLTRHGILIQKDNKFFAMSGSNSNAWQGPSLLLPSAAVSYPKKSKAGPLARLFLESKEAGAQTIATHCIVFF
jgi:hypothetical protein